MAVAAALGHPFAPFVVSQDGTGKDRKNDNDENNLHGRCTGSN